MTVGGLGYSLTESERHGLVFHSLVLVSGRTEVRVEASDGIDVHLVVCVSRVHVGGDRLSSSA